jgi:DNA/RNA-binding domain of Phe-tRNA-synthetase-like protein
MTPHGGHATEKIQGEILLGVLKDQNSITLVGDDRATVTPAGMFSYSDDFGPLSIFWNHKDAARACIEESSDSIILIIENPNSILSQSETVDVVSKLKMKYEAFYDGTFKEMFLESNIQ